MTNFQKTGRPIKGLLSELTVEKLDDGIMTDLVEGLMLFPGSFHKNCPRQAAEH
jgi:hypothetical protein